MPATPTLTAIQNLPAAGSLADANSIPIGQGTNSLRKLSLADLKSWLLEDFTPPSDGVDGRTLLSGTGIPLPELGEDGDFYFDITPGSPRLFGPKINGQWPGGQSLGGGGKSAYQYAVEGGYTGSEIEFGPAIAAALTSGGNGTPTPTPAPVGTLDSTLVVTLSFAGAATAYPPQLILNLSEIVRVSDKLHLQACAEADFILATIDKTVPISGTQAAAHSMIFADLAQITSPAQTYFRARIERGNAFGPWSNIVKHGDSTAPTITCNATATVQENVPLAFSLTANEIVTWSILAGGDADYVELSGSTLRLIGNALLNFEVKQSYTVNIRATDLGGNSSDKTITITVEDALENPAAFSFAAQNSVQLDTLRRSNVITVSGLPNGYAAPYSSNAGTIIKNGAVALASGTAVNGDAFAIDLQSSANTSTTTSATLTIGGQATPVSSTFSVSTLAPALPGTAQWTHSVPGAARTGILQMVDVPIGTASASRLVVVAVTCYDQGNGNTPRGNANAVPPTAPVDIGGIAATQIGTTNGLMSMWFAIVPTGTTATINVRGLFVDAGAAVAVIDNVNPSSAVTTTLETQFNYAPFTVPAVTPANGVTLAIANTFDQPGIDPTWTGATKAVHIAGQFPVDLATRVGASNVDIAVNGYATGTAGIIAVSWGQ